METLTRKAKERVFGMEEIIPKKLPEALLIKSKNARELLNLISIYGPQTSYELSKKLDKNYSIVHRTLQKMVKNNILKRTNVVGSAIPKISYDITPTAKDFVTKKRVLEKEFGNELVPSFIKWALENKILSEDDDVNLNKIKDVVELISLFLASSKTREENKSKKISNVHSAFDKAFGSKKKTSIAKERFEEIEKLASEEFDVQMHKAKIIIVGVGGAGCNTVSRLTDIGASGAQIIAINTDKKHLFITNAHKKLLIGKETTKGLGAGGYPQIGEKSAIEQKTQIKQLLEGADLVFVTAGMGGGTGTGAAPVVAEIAKSLGAIVIGAVTMPFKMEGTRMQKAEDGLARLRQVTDTTVVIENQKLLEYAGSMPLAQAFALADELIAMMAKGISETITVPSLVNLDFADVKTIFKAGGISAVCVGEADKNSKSRIRDAVEKALNHPLLEVDYSEAFGALIHIVCGPDCTLAEINEAGELISKRLSQNAQVIWGARVLKEYLGKVQVIAIITGVKSPYLLGPVQTEETAKENKIEVPVKIENFGVDNAKNK